MRVSFSYLPDAAIVSCMSCSSQPSYPNISLNINIGDYEIDNTGNTDVTSKIQELFNYVRDNGGGKITFPSGEYYIRNYIDVYSSLL